VDGRRFDEARAACDGLASDDVRQRPATVADRGAHRAGYLRERDLPAQDVVDGIPEHEDDLALHGPLLRMLAVGLDPMKG
jgi:hypothetical protein